METPELDKIAAVRGESATLSAFLDYLEDDGIILSRYSTPEGLLPVYISHEKLLADFFEIDLKKAEEERRAVLEELRTHNEEKS